MVDFWLDSNSLITARDTGYGFDIAPGFWKLLEAKAAEGTIRSPIMVYDELQDVSDDLATWARTQKAILFVEPDQAVQQALTNVADYVQANFDAKWAKPFMDGADPWLIAHAATGGGRIVTFEAPVGVNSHKVKIPDIAQVFGVTCVNTWTMARELGLRLG